MTERSKPEDWKNIVESTFKITESMIGRGKAYDLTIAKTLNIAGIYQVVIYKLCIKYIKVILMIS